MLASLRDVITYIIYNAKCPPTKTSLIKLVYMADYYHWQLHGNQLTDCEYHLDNYGAVCFDIPDVAQKMVGKDMDMTVDTFPGGKQVTYKQMENSQFKSNLTGDQESILQLVIERHSGQSLPELKKSHYATEPMENVKNKGEKLDMNTIKRTVKTKDNNRIKKLQKHIKTVDLSESGSKEDRADHSQAIITSMSTARNRANAAILKGK